MIDPRQGSVSVGVWQMACRRVIKVGERTVKGILGEFSLISIIIGYLSQRSLVVQHLRDPSPSQLKRRPKPRARDKE
jgi:hypothetical protein